MEEEADEDVEEEEDAEVETRGRLLGTVPLLVGFGCNRADVDE